jgi:thiopeptide-type bacteriocin biosynthesis protein
MEEIFSDFGKALIRTPLYSSCELFNGDGSTCSLESLVYNTLKNPVFSEALYWSSPQLYERVEQLKAGMLHGEKEKSLLHTLKKYLIRAYTRPTPYGIFAGTAIIAIDGKGPAKPGEMKRKVRVDSGLLQIILHRIQTDPAIYPKLRYLLNDTLYRIPGQFRFTEILLEDGKTRYQLSSLEDTPLLDKIYRMMAGKQLTLPEIFEQSEAEVSFDVFKEFLEELIKSQFLKSELLQGPTIKEEINRYLKVLKRLQAEGMGQAEMYIDLLASLQITAGNFQSLPLGNLPMKEIEKIKEQLKKCKIIPCQDHLFHVDLKKAPPMAYILTSEQVAKIKNGVRVFAKLSGNKENASDRMASFKTLFLKKYGSGEIPLSEALDPEYGIGFPASDRIGDTLFNSLIENDGQAGGKSRQSSNKEFLQKTEVIYFPTAEEINLEEKDLPPGKEMFSKIPSYFSVMGSVLSSGQILMEGVGNAHANALPGRFAGLEAGINSLCKELADDEQRKNEEVVFAEIVFQPGGRIGNIARRNSFFQYEIPYMSGAGVKKERQIPVNDLLLSVRNNEVVLRSARLHKRVIPRLSNAHNFTISALPVYQFLSFLQYPDKTGLEIDWGKPGFERRFLPRVTYENLILHRARWFCYREDIMQITSGSDPIALLKDFISKWKIPRFIALSEGDNELLIDTLNPEYLDLLLREMQKRTLITFVEWPFGATENGKISTEYKIQQFILPLEKKEGAKYLPFTQPESPGRIKESFAPGSEWLYFKIYCSAGFSDKILMEIVKPSVEILLKEEVVSKAFFIRYTDPHYHIRLRFHLRQEPHKKNVARALDCVYNRIRPFLNAGIMWDLQLDTYRPETERYGAESMTESEMAFFHDSRLFLRCLAHEVFSGNDETRFLGAIKNLDKWLSHFQLGSKEKLNFCEAMVESFSNEFGPETKFNVDVKYRLFSNLISTFLGSFIFEREFEEREASLLKLSLPQKNLGSYIHMSMNRWFVTEQRLLEYMSYVFAAKYYKQILHYHKNL